MTPAEEQFKRELESAVQLAYLDSVLYGQGFISITRTVEGEYLPKRLHPKDVVIK